MYTETEIREPLGKRHKIIDEIRQIDADANKAQRVRTAEENERRERLVNEAADLDALARQMEDENRMEREIAESTARIDAVAGTDARVAFNNELRQGMLDGTYNQEFKFNFSKAEQRIRAGDTAEKRLASDAGASTGTGVGAELVPEEFLSRIYESRRDNSAIKALGPEILNTATGRKIPVPINSRKAVSAQYAQGATITVSGGTTAGSNQPRFIDHDLDAYALKAIVPVSFQLLRDEDVDLVSWLSGHLGRALAYQEDGLFISGDGSNKPLGINDGSAGAMVGGTSTVSGGIAWTDVVAIQYSVGGGYVGSAAASDMMNPTMGTPGWLMDRTTLGAIYGIQDNDNRPIYEPRRAMDQPDMLDGYRVATTDQMPSLGTGVRAMTFGNYFEAMIVRQVNMVRFDIDTSIYFESDQVAFRAICEVDSHVRDREAVKALVISSG